MAAAEAAAAEAAADARQILFQAALSTQIAVDNLTTTPARGGGGRGGEGEVDRCGYNSLNGEEHSQRTRCGTRSGTRTAAWQLRLKDELRLPAGYTYHLPHATSCHIYSYNSAFLTHHQRSSPLNPCHV